MAVHGQDLSISRFVKVEHRHFGQWRGAHSILIRLYSLLDVLTALEEGSQLLN